jgi:hypothetical protein
VPDGTLHAGATLGVIAEEVELGDDARGANVEEDGHVVGDGTQLMSISCGASLPSTASLDSAITVRCLRASKSSRCSRTTPLRSPWPWSSFDAFVNGWCYWSPLLYRRICKHCRCQAYSVMTPSKWLSLLKSV